MMMDRLNGAGAVMTKVILCLGVVSLTACVGDKKLSLGLSDSTPTTVTPPVITAQAISSIGGLIYNTGHDDGTGAAATFSSPAGMAVDSAGNTYVADYGNHVIRKITPAGVVTTLAGTAGVQGSADGTGAAASFKEPYGVAVDASGNVYVADAGNAVIRKITPAGVVTTLAGTVGVPGSADGTGTAATFRFPVGIAADAVGNVYVTDYDANTIRQITPAGVVTTLAGADQARGSDDGTGGAARFNRPVGLTIDSTGNLYVADTSNQVIRKITPAGVTTTIAGTPGVEGSADGTGAAASFNAPYNVSIDTADNVYVTDYAANTIRKITPTGVVTTLAGTAGQAGGLDAQGSAARFSNPFGLAVNSNGDVLVADTYNNAIRKVTSSGAVTTLAGLTRTGSADGAGSVARFNNPLGAATDASGNVYVVDYGNDTIRKITSAGVVSTLAGTAGVAGSADGTGAAASFTGPGGLATDSAGNIYVAETENNLIRKITPTGVVTTLAGAPGTSNDGSDDGTGAAASFKGPGAPVVDSAGNVYVTDGGNNTIRKITPAGEVTTFAGTAGSQGSADGTGASASFNAPSGLAIDGSGNLYVTDSGNHTIRKITPEGVVTTLAGTAGLSGTNDGTGVEARFNSPQGVVSDSAGNLYVADTENQTIRKITPSGVVTTIVGVAGQAGFSAGSLPGLLNYPVGVALTGNSLYITSGDGVAVVTLP